MNYKDLKRSPNTSPSGDTCHQISEVKPISNSSATEDVCKINEAANDTVAIQQTFDFIGMFSNFLGWKFSYDWKSNPKHWFASCLTFFICSQYIYSQVLYIKSGEYNRVFEVIAMYGISFSCALKIWMFLNYRKEMTALHKFSIEITRQAGRHLVEKLATQQFYIVKLCKIFAVIGLLGELLYIYQPVAELIITRKLVPLMPIEMMFLDPTKILDFVIFNSILAAVGVWCPFLLFAVNFNFTTAILNCKIQVTIIEDDIQRLDTFWRKPKTTTVLERHMLLKNICQKCQDKNRYVDEIKNIFDRPLFWYFCLAYTSQVICLYEIEVENWMPGYGIACGSFTEMMIYCFIGTKLFQINEQLCSVLSQAKWYTWDVCSQKIFLNLLNSCMNFKELWIGPLAPLSVVTLIQMVKSIYTYYTFLSEAV